MKFVNKINNNVALAQDEHDVDWVLIGRGIGFGKEAGDPITEDQIDRRFKAQKDEVTHQNPPAMLQHINPDTLQLATLVSDRVAERLGIHFSNYNYLALADHIDFALERAKGDQDYPTELRWDVKNLFPKEYAAAQYALALIQEQTGVKLPPSELTFFTYHFVSAQSDETLLEDTVEVANLANRIIEIVSYSFQMQPDPTSLNYARFMTHLRYFIIRQLKGGSEEIALDPLIGEVVKERYPKAYQAAVKIAEYLHQSKGWTISESEKMYLTLHIWRLTRE